MTQDKFDWSPGDLLIMHERLPAHRATGIFDPDTHHCFPLETEDPDFWFVSCDPKDSLPEDGTVVTEVDEDGVATMKLPKRSDRRVFNARDIRAWVAVNHAPRSVWRWKQ